jgi:hypothetical protein
MKKLSVAAALLASTIMFAQSANAQVRTSLSSAKNLARLVPDCTATVNTFFQFNPGSPYTYQVIIYGLDNGDYIGTSGAVLEDGMMITGGTLRNYIINHLVPTYYCSEVPEFDRPATCNSAIAFTDDEGTLFSAFPSTTVIRCP